MPVLPASGNLPTTYPINSGSAESKNIGEAKIDTKFAGKHSFMNMKTKKKGQPENFSGSIIDQKKPQLSHLQVKLFVVS